MNRLWYYGRLVLLVGIIFLFVYFIYDISIPRRAKYNIKVGTFVTTALLVGVSLAFASYIDMFSNYPVVYGSLASIVLLMLWLYLCCFSMLLGAVLNVVLHFRSQREELIKAEERRFEEEFTEYKRIDDEFVEVNSDEYYDDFDDPY